MLPLLLYKPDAKPNDVSEVGEGGGGGVAIHTFVPFSISQTRNTTVYSIFGTIWFSFLLRMKIPAPPTWRVSFNKPSGPCIIAFLTPLFLVALFNSWTRPCIQLESDQRVVINPVLGLRMKGLIEIRYVCYKFTSTQYISYVMNPRNRFNLSTFGQPDFFGY